VKIAEILVKAKKELDESGVGSSRLDSLILLSYAISFSREQLIFNPDFELDFAQQQNFFTLLERRKARQPVSQIIGKREFFGGDFFVNSDVLDPRPDSESLIELVLERFPNCDEEIKILELGVGSGCLIITLLKAFKNAAATAVDVSDKALEVAKKNAQNHQVLERLKLQNSNLFSALNDSSKFDLIISNPPYIPSKEIENLQAEVRLFEPLLALDGGVDGLDFYRKIAAQSQNFLSENGQIILEIGFGQKEDITKIFTQKNFSLEASKLDLPSVERALCFVKKS
jgi:release factor glutamine methyltransferase